MGLNNICEELLLSTSLNKQLIKQKCHFPLGVDFPGYLLFVCFYFVML